jgi:tripartite-type tricarboxylate transporter receptor subunit TctC
MKRLYSAIFLLANACAQLAWAQAYPTKPVRIIVNFPPGGVNDVTARVLAPYLSKALGQPVIIDNKPGAGTTIGTDFVAKSTPDGHVLMVAASSTAISPSLYASLPYDPAKDLAPIALIGSTTNYLVVGPKTPASSVRQLVDYARRNPGKLNYASSGNGSSTHLTAELMKQQGKFFAVHIPYRGVGPAMAALLAGEVDFLFDAGPASVPSIRAGRVRLLAVSTRTRSPLFPDTPTMVESGFPDFDVDSWTGIMTTGGTPQPVIDRLEAELHGIVALPEVHAAFAKLGMAVRFSGSKDFAEYYSREMKRWAAAVKYSGARAD